MNGIDKMAEDYQTRKDINRLYRDIYNIDSGDLALVRTDGLFNLIYPVGSLYRTVSSTFNPSKSFGGNWVMIDSTNNIYTWERR